MTSARQPYPANNQRIRNQPTNQYANSVSDTENTMRNSCYAWNGQGNSTATYNHGHKTQGNTSLNNQVILMSHFCQLKVGV